MIVTAEGLTLVLFTDDRAIEEPVGRAMRELGLTQQELARRLGCHPGDLSNARSGRRPFGRRRTEALAEALGVDLTRPQYELRCGLWLRNGVPDAGQRAALRAEVSRRRRAVALRDGRLSTVGRRDAKASPPSSPVGGSSAVMSPAFRSLLSPRAREGLREFEEDAWAS